MINEDAYEDGWIVRIKAESIDPIKALMDAKEYEASIPS